MRLEWNHFANLPLLLYGYNIKCSRVAAHADSPDDDKYINIQQNE